MRTNRYMQIAVFGGTLLFFVLWQTAAAGPPEKPGNPGVPGLLAEISELNDIVATQQENIDQQLARIAELEDMLNQLQNFAPVARTGQTDSYAVGDDGDLQMGITWPDPRFIDNEDGTVTDNLTGLIWLKNADCFYARTWNEALSDSNSLADEQCGLTDGSSEGDWRLANARELSSLIDFGQFDIALPAGHPFINVQPDSYWSSTTFPDIIQQAWRMCIHCGHLSPDNKTDHHYVWPVRGGQ